MPSRVLDAASIGVLARRALARAERATVIAAFERSFYLDVGDTLIAVVAPNLHDGPLTIRLNPPIAGLDVETGQPWTAAPDRLQRNDGLAIDLTPARLWKPDLPKAPPEPSRLKEGLERLLGLLHERDLPEDGLLGLVIDGRPPRNAIERSAAPPIDALRKDLPRWFANGAVDPPPIVALIGLGPGLTPSGDDLLGGVLITCRHLGETQIAQSLAATVNAVADTATTPISRAHLAAAAEGYGAAPLHDLLHAILITGQRGPRRALDAVAEIGHSSGFDALAGMILTLQSHLAAQA